MKTEHAEALSDTFCRVIEQLAFMFAEPAEPDVVPQPAGPCVAVAMEFSGVFGGSLRLAVPAAICAELAGNMLGMDLDDGEAAARGTDSLKELLNITCGNILTEIAGTEAVFTLTIPAAEPLEPGKWDEFRRREGALAFLIDDNPALLELVVKGEAA
ncbi:chemotaxis protein CheX [bacterium]|nr:chemotaxis protein CheX [bacterium]